MRCLTMDTHSQGRVSSQYKRYNFNSMRRFGNMYIGANATGMYILDGNDDNGNPINAKMRTGVTDLGTLAKKRLRFVYLVLKTSGDLEIDVIADNSVVRTYAIEAMSAELHRVRVPVGRDIKGFTWAFEVRNLNGATFSLHIMETLPVVLHRGQV